MPEYTGRIRMSDYRDFTAEGGRRLGHMAAPLSGMQSETDAYLFGKAVERRWNAIDQLDDLFAEPKRDDHDAVDASIRAEQIVRRAINGEG